MNLARFTIVLTLSVFISLLKLYSCLALRVSWSKNKHTSKHDTHLELFNVVLLEEMLSDQLFIVLQQLMTQSAVLQGKMMLGEVHTQTCHIGLDPVTPTT